MKNIKSTKNANKAITATSNEGYCLGSSKDGWDGITSEGDGLGSSKDGDGYESKRKPLTAWAVEIDGEISPYDVVGTRAFARSMRNDIAGVYGSEAKVSVRKVMITQIKGR